MCMTKSELIRQLINKYPHLYQRDLEKAVDAIFSAMSEKLVEGGRIELRGFGTFSIRKREPRKARNPKSGEALHIGKRHVIYFRPGQPPPLPACARPRPGAAYGVN